MALVAGSLISAEVRDRAKAADHLGPDRLSYHLRSGEISVEVDVVGPNSGLEPPGDCELGDADNQDRCAEPCRGYSCRPATAETPKR